MDRFIAAPAPAITLCNYNLKSNMDRFIAGYRGGIINEKII